MLNTAREGIFARQHGDGRWEAFNDGGVPVLAVLLVTLALLDALTPGEQQAGVRALRASLDRKGGAPGHRAAPEPSVDAEYLLAHQDQDGLWSDEPCQGVMMPHVACHSNTTFSTCCALQTLGLHRGEIGR